MGTARRRLILAVLAAAGFVSGVGASQDETIQGQVLASFAPVAIEDLPIHAESEEQPIAETPPAPADPYEPDPGLLVVTRGEIERGESLARDLERQGVSAAMVHLIASKMKPVFDFRHSQPGQRYRLALDPEGNLVDFRYRTSAEDSVLLYWNGEGYSVRKEAAELHAKVATIAGIVDQSLYDSIQALGEDPQLAGEFAEIFAWDIDFTRSVKSGDDFRILYERLYLTDDDGQEVYVRPGRILAAIYRGAGGEHSAFYYSGEESGEESGEASGKELGERSGESGERGDGVEEVGGYFRADGSSIERSFLIAPLKYRRISSSFSKARLHPILNITRPHPGIDYAAAEGTPLYAVADGTVIYKGWAGASGNLVKIRHANGYVSHYAHLSHFAPDLKVGKRVKQKEVIGQVGHTGLATGPHVCFRVTRNGRYVNPLKIQSPAGHPVAPDQLPAFERIRDGYLASLEMRSQLAADTAL